MKVTLITLAFTIVSSFQILAQNASSISYLDYNNVKALFHSNGELFSDPFNFASKFEVPSGSGLTAIYNAGIWVSAIDQSDSTLHASACNLAGDPSLSGFYEGPIASNYGGSWDNTYRTIWKIDKSDINQHILSYDSTGYTMPFGISNWPAHGDTLNGEAWELAPYVDENQNDIYDPENGDYPCIKGDQALYIIFNDVRSSTSLNSLGIEVHLMAYSYATDDHVNNTIFLEYKVINRSQRTYQDLYISKMLDFDFGCPLDDLIGCDSSLNLFYTYNGDNFDENCISISGYGSDPGAIGVTVLNQKLYSFINYVNAGSGSTFRTEPVLAQDYYNFSQAKWKDGSHMVSGGSGHTSDPGASTIETNYVFPGDPSDTATWTEVSEMNLKGDRKGVGSVKFNSLQPNEFAELTYAVVYAKGLNLNSLQNVDELKSAVADVRAFYDNDIQDCLPSWTNIQKSSRNKLLKLFPNPTTGRFTIRVSESTNSEIYVFNSVGKLVYQKSLKGLETEVNLPQNLNDGVYFINYLSTDGFISEKLFLQRP